MRDDENRDPPARPNDRVAGVSPRYDCPGCADRLEPIEAQIYRLECASCRGIWLDGSGTDAVVRGAISVVDDEAAVSGKNAPRSPYRGAPRLVEGRVCPFCRAGLELVTVPELGVALDICRAHGTWFDATELDAVVEHYVDKRSREEDVIGMLLERARTPSLRARRWHPFW